MSKFISGILHCAAFGLVAILVFGQAVVRFQLITVHPALWLFLFGTALSLMGLYIKFSGNGGGVTLATSAILFTLGALQVRYPHFYQATSRAQGVVDLAAADVINNFADLRQTPQKVPCEPPFFVGEDQHPQYHYLPRTNPLECYTWTGRDPRKDGQHPNTRETLFPMTPEVARQISQAQAPPPTTIPAATIPDLALTPVTAILPVIMAAPNQRPIGSEEVQVHVGLAIDVDRYLHPGSKIPATLDAPVWGDSQVIATQGSQATITVTGYERRNNTIFLELQVTHLTAMSGAIFPAPPSLPIKISVPKKGRFKGKYITYIEKVTMVLRE